jgi:hypothetical protein
MKDITRKTFVSEKEGAVKDAEKALSLYRRDYDSFIRFVNDAFLEFGDEKDRNGKVIGKFLLVSYGGPTFYIFRNDKGDLYWVFSWEYTIERKIRKGSRAERLFSRLFDILES